MSVVPLIQPPRLVNISLILEAHLLKNNIRCVSCSKQSWRVPHIKMITKFIEERSSFRWLFDTFFTQRTIDPPLKNTILVHCWLTVSNKNNRNNITISIGLAVVWQILLIIYNQVVVDATQIDIWKAWWHFQGIRFGCFHKFVQFVCFLNHVELVLYRTFSFEWGISLFLNFELVLFIHFDTVICNWTVHVHMLDIHWCQYIKCLLWFVKHWLTRTRLWL